MICRTSRRSLRGRRGQSTAGVLGGTAALITAVGGTIGILMQTGVIGGGHAASSPASPQASPSVTATPPQTASPGASFGSNPTDGATPGAGQAPGGTDTPAPTPTPLLPLPTLPIQLP